MHNSQLIKKHESIHHLKIAIFIKYLHKRGHRESTIREYRKAVLHFLQWLNNSELQNKNLCIDVINDFLYRHLPDCKCAKPNYKSLNILRAALHHFYLCIKGEKIPDTKNIGNNATIETEISAFSKYLKDICGLSDNTCIYRIRNIRSFLYSVFDESPFDVSVIKKNDFLFYISTHTGQCTPGTKNVIACSLRCYVKYLQFSGVAAAGFLRMIPSVPNWKLASIPASFSEEEITKLLHSFDCTTPVGKRDYAMALCMTDLGLRASEIARLTLHDIDWRQSIIYIKATKSRRDRNLPLPKRLGKALVHYIKQGRLSTSVSNIFVRHTVPHGIALNTEQVRGAMRRAYIRVGFSKSITGTHILRHTAASRMHQNGTTIKELADVLGHRCLDTTLLYTKIDIPELKKVILPWPGAENE